MKLLSFGPGHRDQLLRDCFQSVSNLVSFDDVRSYHLKRTKWYLPADYSAAHDRGYLLFLRGLTLSQE